MREFKHVRIDLPRSTRMGRRLGFLIFDYAKRVGADQGGMERTLIRIVGMKTRRARKRARAAGFDRSAICPIELRDAAWFVACTRWHHPDEVV